MLRQPELALQALKAASGVECRRRGALSYPQGGFRCQAQRAVIDSRGSLDALSLGVLISLLALARRVLFFVRS